MEEQFNWETLMSLCTTIDYNTRRYWTYNPILEHSYKTKDGSAIYYTKVVRNCLVETYNAVVGIEELLYELP